MIEKVKQDVRSLLIVAEMTFRLQVMDTFILFGIILQPLMITAMAMWILKDKGPDAAIFVVVGSGMTGIWSTILFVSGNSINDERWYGTLETMVGVPTPLNLIILGKNFANVFQAIFSMLVSFLVVTTIFGYHLEIIHPWAFVFSCVLTIFTFICFGLILAPFFVLNPMVGRFQNGLEFPVYILSGFLFPITLLPGWTTPISYLLPTFWAAKALHATSSGAESWQQIYLYWGLLIVFSVVYLVASKILTDRVLLKARTDATLDLE